MEGIDEKTIQQVWQRVRSHPVRQQDPGPVKAMIAQLRQDAATYLLLARRFTGQDSVMLRELARQDQAQAMCLKGLFTLITGERPPQGPVPQTVEGTESALRRCYGNKMRLLSQYEDRMADPEYGPVFQRLAYQQRQGCTGILELLGRNSAKT